MEEKKRKKMAGRHKQKKKKMRNEDKNEWLEYKNERQIKEKGERWRKVMKEKNKMEEEEK